MVEEASKAMITLSIELWNNRSTEWKKEERAFLWKLVQSNTPVQQWFLYCDIVKVQLTKPRWPPKRHEVKHDAEMKEYVRGVIKQGEALWKEDNITWQEMGKLGGNIQ